MHGSGGERWKQRRHMWPVHSNSTAVACELSATDFFLKDGRKIQVGDCALFKPPLDSPPFIGIIRSLKSDKETNLRLDVNWLYRPADVKLPKGILLDAAPNEIFYSFHKDEIPAASLLHPCKVAFLRKGVELPSSISSFVCRRVYDTDNKCLWWLTDRDYINERQEEVDQLLEKTRLEMHGVMQSGGRSPKPLNGSIPAVQPKSGSESVPNSSFLTSHVKSKKRERGDQGSEPTKRERLCKAEDGEFGQFRSESMLKNEIAKLTDKGGLVDFEGVEKFVKLMQPDSSGKKIDLADRMMLADVIAVTDRFDCLEWFLQLRGLPVLDEWLQEVHKGKIGDANGMKGSDKTVEDFLLALLRALDKLPVNLNALQTCNVGKSVNHLRTHKNSEIQKKARSLVDTWKKRVEAEMDVNDAKSSESSRGVSWPSKSGPLEVSQVGSRKAGGSGDDGLKSSTHSNMFKHSQPKFGPTEMVVKSSALSSTTKFSSTVGASSKDYNFKTLVVGNSDLPLTPIKEERSSSSSQSQNNSQSSDHAKTVASSCKEETRSSNSGSGSVSKVSSGGSRHRKSSNGIHLNTITGIQKVSGSGKLNAINKSLTTEKASTTSHEKSPDASLVEHGYSRLVVKLPNTCRSPMGTSRVVTEDQVFSCHKGSLHDEAGDNHDKKAKGRSDLLGASFGTEANSNQCHMKDQFLSSEEGKEIAACDEQSRLAEANEEQSETIASLTGIISRPGKTYDASLSSINALIESCVKFSETNTSSSPGDAVGMNLLASVATGEISKSNNASPLDSPQERSPLAEESSAVNDGQLKIFPEGIAKNKCEEADANGGAWGCTASEPFGSNNMLQDRNGTHPASTSADSSRDGRGFAFGSSRDCIMPSKVQQKMERAPSKSDIKPDAEACDGSAAVCSSYGAEEGNTEIEEKVEGLLDSLLEEGTQLHENKKVDQTDERTIENGVVLKSDVTAATIEVEKQVDAKTSCLSSQLSGSAVQTHEDLTSGCGVEEKLSSTSEIRADSQEKVETAMILPEANPLDAEFKDKKEDTVNSEIHVNQIGKQTPIQGPPMSDQKNDCAVQDLGKTDDINNCCGSGSMHLESPAIPLPESDQGEKLSLNVPELIGTKDHVTSENPLLSASRSDTVVKLDFDLNEGCCVDDGTQEEIIGSSSAVQMPMLPPFSMPSASESFPVSITVASAAKGSVVPPENSLANKVELGWKGSAATSAFRRAEPRKNLEMPLSLSDASLVTTTSKEGRPPLDFDLNVPDQRLLEEVALSNVPGKASLESGPCDRGGGLDLDLNKVDESNDMGPCSVSKSRLELPMSSRSYVSGGLGNCGFSVSRNFDLNNGPSLDEMGAETAPLSQQNKSYMPFSSLLPGMKVSSGEIGNFYSWFPQGNSYSAITAIPSVLPGRGEQSYVPAAVSQRVFAPPAGTGFAAEIYRAPVLSSSPALAFPPANSFSYSGFPFETSFPLQSNTFSGCSTSYMDSSSGCSLGFPTITSHLLGPAGVVPTPYPRPFIMSYPSSSGTVGPEIGKWGSQGLDLNAGHGIIDKERIDEKLPLALRQLSVPSSQPFADEQLKMFQIGGIRKRKEPDSGLDAADRLNYKQQ